MNLSKNQIALLRRAARENVYASERSVHVATVVSLYKRGLLASVQLPSGNAQIIVTLAGRIAIQEHEHAMACRLTVAS